jgi:hypothetical protein
MRVAAVLNNTPLCGSCYYNMLAPRMMCTKCEQIKPINIWIDEKPFCVSCGKQKEKCSVCGKLRIVKARYENKPICPSCHNSNRMKTDERFRLRCRLSNRLYHALRAQGLKKKGSMVKEYGIDINEIVKRLGSRPSLNHDVDHIVPLCAFDLTDSKQVRLAFAPENMRWLESQDNKVKSGKRQVGDMDALILTVGEV